MNQHPKSPKPFIDTLLLGLLMLLWLAPATFAQVSADAKEPEARVKTGRVCLTIEPLVDDVADLDVRRLTVFTRGPGKANFRFGQAAALQQPMNRVPNTGNLYFFEVVLVTRLEKRIAEDANGLPFPEPVLTQYFNFSKGNGGNIETPFDAKGIGRITDVLDISAKDGCFGFGKTKLIGELQGRRIRVSVDR